MKILTNAFSLNMLADLDAVVVSRVISQNGAATRMSEFESAVGHADTAALYSNMLQAPVPVARKTIALVPGDELLVGQYRGPRLPEGASMLPEGASIVWVHVIIKKPGEDT